MLINKFIRGIGNIGEEDRFCKRQIPPPPLPVPLWNWPFFVNNLNYVYIYSLTCIIYPLAQSAREIKERSSMTAKLKQELRQQVLLYEHTGSLSIGHLYNGTYSIPIVNVTSNCNCRWIVNHRTSLYTGNSIIPISLDWARADYIIHCWA